ncbi:MAG: magnesium transporter [Bacillota bacterium]
MSFQDSKLVEQLRTLLSPDGSYDDLINLVDDLQPYDLSMIIENLEQDEQLRLLQTIPPETAAETLEHFEPSEQYHFLDNMVINDKVEILNHMSSDAVVQLFTAIHPRQTERLFDALQDPFKTQIRNQMSYPENSAGSLANVDYIAARRWWTVERTLDHLRKVGEKAEIYNYIYVLGPRGELVGVLSLRELILAAPETQLEYIMNSKVISVPAELDQEEAARLLAQYDLVAVPVVSYSGKMAGILTVDDVLDIIEEEATEDIQLLGGSQPLDTPYLQSGIFGVFRKRIVWLLLLFFAGTITSNILKHYEEVLAQLVTLAFFIPLLIDTGGNAGAQTSTTIIRAVAVGDVTVKDFFKVIWREMRLGLFLGLAMAAIGLAWTLAQKNRLEVGLIVSATIVVVVTVSSTFGALMPIIGKRLGLDPAVFSAPMITTVVDALGLIIYFQIARMVLGL